MAALSAELPTDFRGELDAPYDFQRRPHALYSFRRLVRVALRDCLCCAFVFRRLRSPGASHWLPKLKGKKGMAEHIEDLQQRYAELNKRIELVRSCL